MSRVDVKEYIFFWGLDGCGGGFIVAELVSVISDVAEADELEEIEA